MRTTPGYCLAALALAAGAAAARAEPAMVESFDGPAPAWRLAPDPPGVRLLASKRTRLDDAGEPVGAELAHLSGPPGRSGMLMLPVGRAEVLEDLRIRVRLYADRPGVQPAMRVVFPRSIDQRSGAPRWAIVRGSERLDAPGEWADLRLDDAEAAVRRHARVMGASPEESVDHREAYVDAVVLIVPTDPRGTRVWIDELTIHGVVREGDSNSAAPARPEEPAPEPRRISLSPSGFTINGAPYYPRVVDHHGAPLDRLAELGFNTVAFAATPSVEQLRECRKLKLHVICPPPEDVNLSDPSAAAPWDTVLAWRLPGEVDERSVDSAQATIGRLRQKDRVLGRPVLAAPTEGWASWSRLVDGMVVAAPPSPAPRAREALARRMAEASAYARPGAPLVAMIPATHSPQMISQVKSFAPAGQAEPWRSPWRVTAESWAATVSGVSGLWITSDAPLAGADGSERTRLALEMLNLRLDLFEPWVRDGARMGRVVSLDGEREAALLSRARTRLLLPSPWRSGARRADPRGVVNYVAPGVAESVKAYALSPVGLAPIGVTRVAGGAQITLGPGAAELAVLLTDDVLAAGEVRARAAATARRALDIQQSLALAELDHAQRTVSPNTLISGGGSPAAAALSEARRWISHSKAAQTSGDAAAAFANAGQARRRLVAWNESRMAAAAPSGRLESCPLAAQPETLIDHRRLLELIEPLERGPNLLAGGDFEQMDTTRGAGWRHVARESSGAAARVEFSQRQPAHGERSLAITCDAGAAPGDAQVEITSPEVNLEAGQLVEITGMVRVDSVDHSGALEVLESLGGKELRIVADTPRAWTPFRLLRRATRAQSVAVTFCAHGPITAGVDAVMIRVIKLPNVSKPLALRGAGAQRK